MNPEQVSEFQKSLEDIKAGLATVKELPATVKSLQDENTKLQKTIDDLKRNRFGNPGSMQRRSGGVSDACARYLGAIMIVGNAKNGRLDELPSSVREALYGEARGILGLEAKTALTTTDIPLPTQYFAEMRELISEFGVVRNKMFPFPLGKGTAKPPRFKTRPTFGSIAMSATVTEKSPQIGFATLESHKLGGLVRVPREIDEQSIVPMGQYLARYGAVEFARAEDTWGFLADGTGTYENVAGICKTAVDNSKVVTLAATKTKPSDATIDDFRAMRLLCNKAALSAKRSAYYLDSTWEVRLRTFNTEADPYIFVMMPDGSAKLDGYPIVWTDVLEPYGTAAAASKFLAVFGALDYWWFAEKGSPRMDFSGEVFFGTDELATRFLEEIDFDYQQVDVTSTLRTAAS